LGSGVFEDGHEQAEDGFLGVVLGEGLVEEFGEEAEDGDAGVIDGLGEGGAEDFELVEADQFLAGSLGEEGAGDGHGFESAAKALAAFEGGFGDAFDAAVVAGEEADDQVGLLDGPGAEDDGF